MPERIPEILETLDTVKGAVEGLTEEIASLKEKVNISEGIAQKADKSSKRSWRGLIFDFALTVILAVGGIFLTVALVHSDDARRAANRTAVNQLQQCDNANLVRSETHQGLNEFLAIAAPDPKVLPPADQVKVAKLYAYWNKIYAPVSCAQFESGKKK